MSGGAEPPEGGGLDPDAAIRARTPREEPVAARPAAEDPSPAGAEDADGAAVEPVRWRPPPPVIDTRRYQWMIGLFGLALVIAFSVYLFAKGGSGVPGYGPGQRLHRFVAPLATSDLDASANADPHCNPARPARRGLNICDRQPTVLAFFALGSDAKACIRQVDTMQEIAPRFPGVQFAAVAVNANRESTDKVVRQQHWTIPIAYDESGVLGQLYGVEVCPLVEIARADGTVVRRLIGEHWLSPGTLTGAVDTLGVK